MDSVELLMLNKIQEWGRGKIFFAEDFTGYGSPEVIRKSLCTMTDDRIIVRLARGVYCYPMIVGDHKIKEVYPSDESIAEAIARRECVRIIPYGDLAARNLGLSGIVASNLMYLTDGAPRKINLSKGRKIYFNHTSEVKMFAFCNETMQMMSSSLRALGKEYLYDDPEKQRKMRKIMHEVPEKDFKKDITIPPAWVGELLLDLWSK